MSIFRQSGGPHVNAPTCRWCAQPAEPSTGLCAYHASEAFRLARQPQRAGYRTKAYWNARRAAMRRAAGKCESCGRLLEKDAKGRWICQTHHVDRNVLNNAVSNLQVCCPACHSGSRAPRP